MALSDRAVSAANPRGASLLDKYPTAVAARYDGRIKRVVIELSSGIELGFRPGDAQGLEGATPQQLKKIEISPSGLGVHFPALDADLYLPALLDGFFGSKSWMARQMGAAGGKAATPAKAAAARANGALGGRPKKRPVPSKRGVARL